MFVSTSLCTINLLVFDNLPTWTVAIFKTLNYSVDKQFHMRPDFNNLSGFIDLNLLFHHVLDSLVLANKTWFLDSLLVFLLIPSSIVSLICPDLSSLLALFWCILYVLFRFQFTFVLLSSSNRLKPFIQHFVLYAVLIPQK